MAWGVLSALFAALAPAGAVVLRYGPPPGFRGARISANHSPSEPRGNNTEATDLIGDAALVRATGELEPELCGLQVVASFFSTKQDWQRHERVRPSFGYMQRFYESALAAGVSVTVVHDGLPEDLVSRYTTPTIRFLRVNLTAYPPELSLNDVRWLVYDDVLRDHPGWRYVFNTDISDVTVMRNPCTGLRPGKLYVGSETPHRPGDPWYSLGTHPWMRRQYEDMGGEYLKWYDGLGQSDGQALVIINSGIVGGSRDVMGEFYAKMRAVLTDPALEARSQGREVHVDQGACDYVVYKSFRSRIVTGAPVHSGWKMYESPAQAQREGHWFIHKLFHKF